MLDGEVRLLEKSRRPIVLCGTAGRVFASAPRATPVIRRGTSPDNVALLFNDAAVLVGLVHTYLPFMIIPLFAAVDRMDWS